MSFSSNGPPKMNGYKENENYQFPNKFDQKLGFQILVVDDNATARQILKIELEEMGLSVDTVEDGLRALALFKEKKYDLIFTDIDMPNIDGWQLTKIIRRKERSRVPIIALSAKSDDESFKVSLKVGMNDHITKPFSGHDLTQTIEKWLLNN